MEMWNAAGQRNLSGRTVSDGEEEWVSGGGVVAKENCRDTDWL